MFSNFFYKKKLKTLFVAFILFGVFFNFQQVIITQSTFPDSSKITAFNE